MAPFGSAIRLLLILFLLVAQALCAPARFSLAEEEKNSEIEYKLKAAFLYNFARFTYWPERIMTDGQAPLVFCVLGEDPFGAALKGIETKQISSKPIRLHYAKAIADALDQCQMIFVSKSKQSELEQVFRFTARKPIVTVSDIDGFAAASGIVEFKNKDGRLAFIINNSQARENGLQISSSLLNLALQVL